MRRADIRLIALARQGVEAARCEVGRRYLVGANGFARHIPTGLSYVLHPAVRDTAAATIVSESLSLQEVVEHRLLPLLQTGARAGNAQAQFLLGLWLWARHRRPAAAQPWLERAGAAGNMPARQLLASMFFRSSESASTSAALQSVRDLAGMNAAGLAFAIALDAAREDDLATLLCALSFLFEEQPRPGEQVNELVVQAVLLGRRSGQRIHGLAPSVIEDCLERRMHGNGGQEALILGLALCGIPVGVLEPDCLVGAQNVRKGAALLLRAADAGSEEAWMHLYRVHAHPRLSVANPVMARFCLEKAAMAGHAQAQRTLGALLLRDSRQLQDTERAIHWLHRAALRQDTHAQNLLSTLVLPVSGSEYQAQAAIKVVRAVDAQLACRLELSRHFGLTKTEALSFDPTTGAREWGLVVDRNPMVHLARLSEGRAIPALSASACDALRHAVSHFENGGPSSGRIEPMRQRQRRLRVLFERHEIDERHFFANAPSAALERLRKGAKWAFHSRAILSSALAQ